MRRSYALPLVLALTVTLTAAECEDPIEFVPEPSDLVVVSGGGQEAEVGAQLASPLVARVVDQNGDPMAGVAVDWSAAAGTITGGGESDANGEVSATWVLGTVAGPQTATASLGTTASAGFTATAVPGPIHTLSLAPDTVELNAVGATATITAAGQDEHENTVEDVDATWASRDTLVATVDAEGRVTAAGNGATHVVADAGGVTDSVVVVVEQEADSVAVTPALDTVAVGGSVDLSAQAFDANGELIADATFSWGSTDAAIATVDAAGSVMGVAEGTARVWAEHGSLRDTAVITVEAASPGLDADLIGEWVTTREVYTSVNDTTQVLVSDEENDLFLLTLRADGTLAYQEEYESGTTDAGAGTWMTSGDTLIVHEPGENTYYFPYTKPGPDQFAFTFEQLETVDVDGDGVGETVSVTAHMSPRTDLPGLVGTWSSTSFVVNEDDGTRSADLTADVSVTADFLGGGSYAVSITEGGVTEQESGWYVTGGGSLWLVEGSFVERFAMDLAADTVTLRFADTFDFDDDGVDEDARFTIRFERGTRTAGDLDADLIGQWVGTSYVLENQADASQEIDVVAEEGWLMEHTFFDDGTWAYQETYADGSVGWADAGTWYTVGDTTIVYSPFSTSDSLLIRYFKPAAGMFSYSTSGEEGWDFDGDGIDEPTDESALMARRTDDLLVGHWVAEAYTSVNANDTTQYVDVLAAGGSVEVTFYADGGMRLYGVEPDLNDEWGLNGEVDEVFGRYAFTDGFLWFVAGGVERVFLTLDGTTAYVISEYMQDIEGDGTEEEVIDYVTLRKQ